MSKAYVGKIPFDSYGNLLSHGFGSEVAEWRDNYEVQLSLVLIGFERGRSAAHAVFRQRVLSNPEVRLDTKFPMFLKELEDLMFKTIIEYGHISGMFTFAKRGTNYGIKWLRK